MSNTRLMAVAGLALSATAAWAQPVALTQSTNTTTITAGNSVSCNLTVAPNQICADNDYWRSFNLNTNGAILAGGLTVSNVQFGWEQAQFPTGTQTITVTLYRDTNGGAPVAVGTDLVQVGTGTLGVANGTLAFGTCNVAGVFAKTDTMVVRIGHPDYIPTYAPPPNGTNTNATGEAATFFIGSNALGQSGPSYIQSVGCGLATPGDLAAIGFPNMHIIMIVNGTTSAGGGGGCYPNCDLSTVAPILNVNDFVCFNNKFAAGDTYANCDLSTVAPVLNVNDFVCFNNKFAAGCT
ncbi:MAG: hypothetical protein JNM80_09300 [Phycisphaerae bacterium]|nr:hypothetical protein [Phycisphaerae bacterium]